MHDLPLPAGIIIQTILLVITIVILFFLIFKTNGFVLKSQFLFDAVAGLIAAFLLLAIKDFFDIADWIKYINTR